MSSTSSTLRRTYENHIPGYKELLEKQMFGNHKLHYDSGDSCGHEI